MNLYVTVEPSAVAEAFRNYADPYDMADFLNVLALNKAPDEWFEDVSKELPDKTKAFLKKLIEP